MPARTSSPLVQLHRLHRPRAQRPRPAELGCAVIAGNPGDAAGAGGEVADQAGILGQRLRPRLRQRGGGRQWQPAADARPSSTSTRTRRPVHGRRPQLLQGHAADDLCCRRHERPATPIRSKSRRRWKPSGRSRRRTARSATPPPTTTASRTTAWLVAANCAAAERRLAVKRLSPQGGPCCWSSSPAWRSAACTA